MATGMGIISIIIIIVTKPLGLIRRLYSGLLHVR